MRQMTLKQKNSKTVITNTKEFYQQYLKEKKGFFYSRELDLNYNKKSRKKEQITYRLFALIVLEYFKVYFHDLLFNSKDLYFFLGGRMTLCVLPKRIRVKVKNLNLNNLRDNLAFFWYLKPSKRHNYIVQVKKAHGSLTHAKKLETKAIEMNMLELFPNFKQLKKDFTKKKLMYRCIQK